MRWSLLLVLLMPMAGGQMALDAESPSLEFVMNKQSGNALEGTTYNYELHPVGAHEPLNGKYYGSSQLETNGFRQFVLTMPYANPEEVPLADGNVNASFVFGVTNRGSGSYQAAWRLLADSTLVAEGESKQFHMQGQETDVGTAWVTWQTPALVDVIPQGANLSLELDVAFSGNAPFIKDRGIVLDLPGVAGPVEEAAAPNSQPADPEPTSDPTPEDFIDTEVDDSIRDDTSAEPAPQNNDEGQDTPSPKDLDWLWVPAIIVVGVIAMIIIQRRG